MQDLCNGYWNPLYAFARRSGEAPEDAEDLVQSFFSEKVIEGRLFETAKPEGGRLRSYLLGAFKHVMSNARSHGQCVKRGGGTKALSLDAEDAEAWLEKEKSLVDHATPEAIYDRACAVTLLDTAIAVVRKDYAGPAKERVFDALFPHVEGKVSDTTIAGKAQSIGLTKGAAKIALHRLRARLRHVIRQEVGRTLENPSEENIDAELRALHPNVCNLGSRP